MFGFYIVVGSTIEELNFSHLRTSAGDVRIKNKMHWLFQNKYPNSVNSHGSSSLVQSDHRCSQHWTTLRNNVAQTEIIKVDSFRESDGHMTESEIPFKIMSWSCSYYKLCHGSFIWSIGIHIGKFGIIVLLNKIVFQFEILV